MEVKIKKIEEKDNLLRIHTECKYGLDNLGLSLKKKYLDRYTDKPQWESEVKQLLGKKYNKEIKLKNENLKS
jgi:hypothetical protein